MPEERFAQDTEDKEQAVAGIRDDHVRKDGMGVPAAFTDQPKDSDLQCDGFSMDKVDDAATVVSVDPAVGRGSADGAGLPLRAERIHVGIKQSF